MVNKTLINQGVTKECAEYCLRSIVQLLNGDTNKFNQFANKALEINREVEEKNDWTSCILKSNGKRIMAKLNMRTKEIRDLEGNTLKEGLNERRTV